MSCRVSQSFVVLLHSCFPPKDEGNVVGGRRVGQNILGAHGQHI